MGEVFQKSLTPKYSARLASLRDYSSGVIECISLCWLYPCTTFIMTNTTEILSRVSYCTPSLTWIEVKWTIKLFSLLIQRGHHSRLHYTMMGKQQVSAILLVAHAHDHDWSRDEIVQASSHTIVFWVELCNTILSLHITMLSLWYHDIL